MMEAALRIDEAWDEGSLHEFFLLYYGALPESMGERGKGTAAFRAGRGPVEG